MLRIKPSLVIFLMVAWMGTDAQPYAQLGRPCPDFTMRNIEYWSKKEATLKDFRGKWLILDFWNEACSGCIASFPRINSLQKTFQNELQYMMVGSPFWSEKGVRDTYAKYREKLNLVMPCAFDSALDKQLDDGYGNPFLILIDPKGIVRAFAAKFDSAQLRGFFSGNPPKMPFIERSHDTVSVDPNPGIRFDFQQPFLVAENGGNDTAFLFRSLLSTWDPKTYSAFDPDNIKGALEHTKNKFQALQYPLEWLYNMAWYGKKYAPTDGLHAPHPMLEIKDSALLVKRPKAFFCYSLILPSSQASEEKVMEVMRSDLANYFPFVVTLEKRMVPCWRIVATKKARKALKSKGGKPDFIQLIPKASFQMVNLPMRSIIPNCFEWFTDDIIIDDTHMKGNIDLTMDCIWSFDDVHRELKVHGLDLVPGQTERITLVVRGKK